ncbi:hypothetical protein K0M31_001844 [Melipona bicolor]|uniref:Uncharacterized protein n=1 Tax=Melipona bicolor TaxID=60889 RepID=A0AA40GGL3_9HYME|nr:hypothetical protein K0M31_001844 [Melipona bicolor]
MTGSNELGLELQKVEDRMKKKNALPPRDTAGNMFALIKHPPFGRYVLQHTSGSKLYLSDTSQVRRLDRHLKRGEKTTMPSTLATKTKPKWTASEERQLSRLELNLSSGLIQKDITYNTKTQHTAG